MKHYKTTGLLFVFALMMLVNGAAAQTSNDNGPKPSAAAMAQDVPTPAATLFTSTQTSTTNPFQIGHKYMVTSSQTSTMIMILVDGVKGDWIQIRFYDTSKANAPLSGGGMWLNSIFLTSASETK